jgi:hypothetical protein
MIQLYQKASSPWPYGSGLTPLHTNCRWGSAGGALGVQGTRSWPFRLLFVGDKLGQTCAESALLQQPLLVDAFRTNPMP